MGRRKKKARLVTGRKLAQVTKSGVNSYNP